MIPERKRRSRPMEKRPMKPPSCSLICSRSKPPCDSGATQISDTQEEENQAMCVVYYYFCSKSNISLLTLYISNNNLVYGMLEQDLLWFCYVESLFLLQYQTLQELKQL